MIPPKYLIFKRFNLNALFKALSPEGNKSPTPYDPTDLDTPLLEFGEGTKNYFRVRDACEGVQIFGAIGSGKTSGSGATLARQYLLAGYGGLVLCAKPEERKIWQNYAAQTGREGDLLIVSPEGDLRFNFLDYELRRTSRGGGDKFWERAMNELLRNAIDLLSLSKGTITLQDIYALVMDAPRYPEQIGEERWRATSLVAECFRLAEKKHLTPREQHDFEMTAKYWLKVFPELDPRPRTSIIATFTTIADILLHGIAWEQFCTRIDIVPEVTYMAGKIILVDLPVQEFLEVGRVVNGIYKFMFQRAILRRDAENHPLPVFLWVDEAQFFLSSFDYHFQSVARSARACTVYLTQNRSLYETAFGAGGKDKTDALLANFQTKVFHLNGDPVTNEYAANTIAKAWTERHNYGMSTTDAGQTRTGGTSDALEYKVQPAEFTTLRNGGTANDRQVDAILFQAGRRWHGTGEPYLRTTFLQA